MKKILLIEDRKERQKLFSYQTKIDFDTYKDILDNKIGQDYQDFYESVNSGEFDFDNYVVVVVHKSAFNGDTQEILYKIEKKCQEKDIALVLFSGGVTSNYYEENDFFKKLELNSKDFYSINLELFLENYIKNGVVEPLILSYGERWKLNILLNSMERINNFISNSKDDDILYDEFVNATDFHLIETLDIDYSKPNIEDGWVYLSEIKEIALSLKKYIKERIIYE